VFGRAAEAVLKVHPAGASVPPAPAQALTFGGRRIVQRDLLD
jgi:hypothetical protein